MPSNRGPNDKPKIHAIDPADGLLLCGHAAREYLADPVTISLLEFARHEDTAKNYCHHCRKILYYRATAAREGRTLSGRRSD